MEDLALRVASRIQITTDGHKVYAQAVEDGHLYLTTPQHQRDAVTRLSELVTNGDELSIWGPDEALATLQIQ